ncbi:EutN/CcmL family microcompartment protein [Vibrio agarivorans]|uniref:EutN/CcmL family microcompartment protein n=1 Tax=Vibrio agarivorans TaxID=153622 RepID=UPI0025B4575D|nr:EutN/CcmL family microcompartment protein [Vibrio agarivorans]MDN3660236.1 EutN/CcmL family microcompartment protein [Vibrio agarivorans]
MYLAKVIGSTVVPQKIPALVGKKIMLVEPITTEGTAVSGLQKVVVDAVGAGVTDTVIVSQGTAARIYFNEPNNGIDEAIVGIVDSINCD